jgi:hypothetical protein
MLKAIALAAVLLFAGPARAYWQAPSSQQPGDLQPALENAPGCISPGALRHGAAGAP